MCIIPRLFCWHPQFLEQSHANLNAIHYIACSGLRNIHVWVFLEWRDVLSSVLRDDLLFGQCGTRPRYQMSWGQLGAHLGPVITIYKIVLQIRTGLLIVLYFYCLFLSLSYHSDVIYLPIFVRVASLALRTWYGCTDTNSSEVTMKIICKIKLWQT